MKVEGLERLNLTFDNSSEKNRFFLFAFLAVQLYVLVTVAGTTDLALVLASSPLNLPIVNVPIPLTGFYLFAPFLLLAFHINLLFNLSEHVRLLDKWFKAGGDTELRFPYVINVIACMKQENRKGFKLFLVSTIATFSIILLPLYIFIYIQVRFSDFHSIWITLYHTVIFLIDFGVLYHYISTLKIKLFPIPKNDMTLPIFFMMPSNPICIPGKWFRRMIYAGVIFPSLANILILSGVLWFTHIAGKYQEFWFTPTLNWFTHITEEYKRSWFIPTLSVWEQSISKINPLYTNTLTPKIIKEHEHVWELYTGIDLQGRHFELADFYRAVLYNVDLRKAHLQGAGLFGANLQGANLMEAHLQGADLSVAKLQGAGLFGANLQGADLRGANLQGADLRSANLQGAGLFYANLQGANLSEVHLQGADLRNTDLQGAGLFYANLQGADLRRADLQGADLEGAQLQGADLGWANLQGADLNDAHLQGADLRNSVISNCTLEGTQLFASRYRSLSTCIGSINSKAIVKYDETEYDFSKLEIWSQIINNLKSEIPEGGLKMEAIERVEKARDYATSTQITALINGTIQETDEVKIREFKEARRTLACTNKWIAYGIRRQNSKYATWYDEGFDDYLRKNRQEIARFVLED